MMRKRTLTRTIEWTAIPTPEELAECFWSMDSWDQARFFNALGAISQPVSFCYQMQFIADSSKLTPEARDRMSTIGEYSRS